MLSGGDGDDNLTGGDGHDSIQGNAGADTITGLRGLDMIWGGDGDDSILGGRGNDSIQGGEGNDSINGGGNGDDALRGGEGLDTIVGGNGNDSLIGGGQNDVLRGSNGEDTIDGGNGLNTAIGGNDLDTCLNAASPDTRCEILDRIDSAAPPARVTVSFPTPSGASGPVDVTGTAWSPVGNVAVNFPLIEGTEPSTPGGPATVDGNGGFTVLTDTTSLDGRLVQIVDSTAGRIKTMTPILMSYSYNDATLTLTLMGPVGETFVAHVYNGSDELVHVEQMTFGEGGSISKVLDDFEDQVGSIDLSRSDADGDVERHENAWTRPPA